jgi:hypothetical protein
MSMNTWTMKLKIQSQKHIFNLSKNLQIQDYINCNLLGTYRQKHVLGGSKRQAVPTPKSRRMSTDLSLT